MSSSESHFHTLMAMPPDERDQQMWSETERLRTFDLGLWPIQDIITPRELAAAGFYYTGVQDRVQCAFCRGVLRNWEHGDNAMNEHRLHFGYCRYATGLNCGNIPASSNAYQGVATGTNVDSAESTTAGQGNEFLPGLSTSRPKHPQYATEARRLQSFSAWPVWALQPPEGLAKAGFYYVGFGDNVKCFFCDGGLRNWDFGDLPWEEHARNFPNCEYMLSIKGKEFSNKLQKNAKSLLDRGLQAEVSSETRNSPHANGTSDNAQTVRQNIQPQDHRSVQFLRRLGFSVQEIEATLNSHFPSHGSGAFPSSTELLNATLQSHGEAGQEIVTDSYVDSQHLSKGPPARSLVEATAERTTTTVGDPSSKQSSNPPVLKTSERQASAVAASAPHRGLPLRPLGELTLVGIPDIPDPEDRTAEEVRQLKKHLECKCCGRRQSEIVLLPCGHFVSCMECVPSLKTCPSCSTSVRGSIRTYLC